MPLNLLNLDQKTREYMILEFEFDLQNSTLYLSKRLNALGKTKYPDALRKSLENGNDTTLATEIRTGLLNSHYQRKNKKGSITDVRMPVNAPDTLAEGEFNRYYIRALCRRVIEEENTDLEIYRAKDSDNPRNESEIKIGKIINPREVLKGLRENYELEKVPSGPNSGLSVKMVPKTNGNIA